MEVFLGGTANKSTWRKKIIPQLEIDYFDPIVDDSNKRPEKTILCVLDENGDKEWTKHQKSSLESVKKMVAENGATVLEDLDEVAYLLNTYE